MVKRPAVTASASPSWPKSVGKNKNTAAAAAAATTEAKEAKEAAAKELEGGGLAAYGCSTFSSPMWKRQKDGQI